MKIDERLGCNIEGRLEHILSLIREGRDQEAMHELAALKPFLPEELIPKAAKAHPKA